MKSAKLVAAVNVGFLGAVILVTLVALRGGLRITLVGILCAGLTIGMYAAPLAAMRTVIRTKSVKYMPFLLTFFQFLNGGVWAAYAVLVKDLYIGVPNGIGLLLGSGQLLLYAMYKNKEEAEKEEEEEEGSAQLVRGGIQMQDVEGGVEPNMKNRSLSLPKPAFNRQYSQKVKKTLSLSPYELDKFTHKQDIEKGFNERLEETLSQGPDSF